MDAGLAEPLILAQQRLQSTNASERFRELFGELLAVAVISRQAYDDPPLTEEEIDAYLQHSFSILNSYRHA